MANKMIPAPGAFLNAVTNIYNPASTYAIGDYCTHGGKIYKCNTPISTAEAWNASHWTEQKLTDALNAQTSALQDAIAIVSNGNTHPQITANQFVYVKNHSTLADGLYKNTSGSTIGANQALTTSNVSADGSGGLNALKSAVDDVNSKITNKIDYPTGVSSDGINLNGCSSVKSIIDTLIDSQIRKGVGNIGPGYGAEHPLNIAIGYPNNSYYFVVFVEAISLYHYRCTALGVYNQIVGVKYIHVSDNYYASEWL